MIDIRWYLAYVLGYDLLHDEIAQSYNNECETSFEICLEILDDFFRSEWYLNGECSSYDALSNWLEENYEYVKEKLNA